MEEESKENLLITNMPNNNLETEKNLGNLSKDNIDINENEILISETNEKEAEIKTILTDIMDNNDNEIKQVKSEIEQFQIQEPKDIIENPAGKNKSGTIMSTISEKFSDPETKSSHERKKRKKIIKQTRSSSASEEPEPSNISDNKLSHKINQIPAEDIEINKNRKSTGFQPTPPSESSKSVHRPCPIISSPESPKSIQNNEPEQENDQQSVPLTDEELEHYRQMAFQQQPIRNLTDEQYNYIINSLIQERNEAAAEHKFTVSDRINSAQDFVQKCLLDKQKAEAQNEAINQYKQQLKEVNDEISQYDQETDRLIKELLESQQKARERLENTHNDQLDKHAEEWTSEKKQRQYNRASHGLINLRKQFKRLMQQNRFKEAGDVQSIITKAEEKEKYEAHLSMQRDYDNSLRMLQTRQKGEKQFFEQQSLIHLAQLKQKRERRRVALVNKQKKVEQIGLFANDAEKVWGKVQNQRKDENLSASGPILSRNGSIISPRTATIKAQDSREDATIPLPPLDVRRSLRGQALVSSHSARI
ncbi:hypothetical protein TVAG_215510 [Trichomonas vaginalis G3]|uniref:Uncharacterized protein n=1 Tax=Trichomonas vaginalis (strain ATCC PRA-98 / G3) TaxID=412133 RepID=A2G6M1_TRIV3|nr:hypothetical protein TVAGG3_0626220 [Trichomonas vaginalis G3]EAX87200.1 hypothetical protein TVAG_215510 [Trichomonas vaginalis G3]KAI5504211.1 hypothetical protein TVAGG3_0626220 [Trichomonas vaginalis G3]|eukprot:XP_001300130.1 hypothetical protein [Trichomonas vaginalis G3]